MVWLELLPLLNWLDFGRRQCEVLSDSRAVEQEKMARLDEVQLQLKDLDVGVGWCALPTLRWWRWCLDILCRVAERMRKNGILQSRVSRSLPTTYRVPKSDPGRCNQIPSNTNQTMKHNEMFTVFIHVECTWCQAGIPADQISRTNERLPRRRWEGI